MVLAILLGLFSWFWRKKKQTRRAQELDSAAAAREIGGNPAAKELYAADQKKELDSSAPPQELAHEDRSHELAAGVNSLPPVELE